MTKMIVSNTFIAYANLLPNKIIANPIHRSATHTTKCARDKFRMYWSRGRNRGKHCCSSWCQSMCLRWLGWIQEHENHRENTTVYPGLGRSMPYVQQLMMLKLKSTKNRGVTIECTGRRKRFGRGFAWC